MLFQAGYLRHFVIVKETSSFITRKKGRWREGGRDGVREGGGERKGRRQEDNKRTLLARSHRIKEEEVLERLTIIFNR